MTFNVFLYDVKDNLDILWQDVKMFLWNILEKYDICYFKHSLMIWDRYDLIHILSK